jgi:hypothetical protein
MAFKLTTLAVSAASSIVGAAMMDYMGPQQGTPAAGGTPATAPRPTNSQPRSNAPGNTPPTSPANTTNPSVQPVNPGVQQPGTVNPGAYQRPFAFQNPQVEARYTQNTRQLVAMEQRLALSNQDLSRRLGEIRELTGERQTAATYDLLQQMLKEQAAMSRYLVRARTAWTGDIEGSVPVAEDEYGSAPEGVTTNPSGGIPAPAGTPQTQPAPR